MKHQFSALEKAILRFKIIKDRMKLYYFISTQIRRIKKYLRWFNWVWVDTHAHNFIPDLFKELLKHVLVISYVAFALALFGITIYAMFSSMLLAILCYVGWILSLPFIIKILEVPLKEYEE